MVHFMAVISLNLDFFNFRKVGSHRTKKLIPNNKVSNFLICLSVNFFILHNRFKTL